MLDIENCGGGGWGVGTVAYCYKLHNLLFQLIFFGISFHLFAEINISMPLHNILFHII